MEHPDFTQALVFTGGGTGGHYYPAIALAEGAKARWPQRPIVFVGARRGIEAKKLPESGWRFLLFDVEGFLGRSPLKLGSALWKLVRARHVLLGLWKRQRPAAVIATGGYGAAPALLAAQRLGIPTFIHESNAEPGALVKFTAKRARVVWLGMAAAAGRLPGARTRTVGTPVREAFRRAFRPVAELAAPLRLLVLGGSGGAAPLNAALLNLAPGLLEGFPDWEILHQTGARDYPELESRDRHPRHRLAAFLEDMDLQLEAASLVLSRSGASTCAELKASGRPSLLVPFPRSAGDHQRWNARALVAEGRARLVEQGEALEARLAEALAELMRSRDLRDAMALPERNDALEACLGDLEQVLD